jgi:hypothetical protein
MNSAASAIFQALSHRHAHHALRQFYRKAFMIELGHSGPFQLIAFIQDRKT